MAFFSSLRVRSREVSARLPRRDKASRRASTNSRLGLAIGRGVERLASELGAALWREESNDSPGLDALLELVGTGSRLTGGLLAASTDSEALVRVGRASAAPRTRLGPEE